MYHVKLYRMTGEGLTYRGEIFYQRRFTTYQKARDFIQDSSIYDAWVITFEGVHRGRA